MKCPKCGYNSFEFHDSCKKCSSDLSGYKQTYGITPLVLPMEIREKMAEASRAASAESAQQTENIESNEDMFALDLPEEATPSAASIDFNDDPFNFDEEPAPTVQEELMPEDDPFANLLETTPQSINDPFGAPPASATGKTAAPTSENGEFELENFSWDDTETTSAVGVKSVDDEFDSFFGDATENTKK